MKYLVAYLLGVLQITILSLIMLANWLLFNTMIDGVWVFIVLWILASTTGIALILAEIS